MRRNSMGQIGKGSPQNTSHSNQQDAGLLSTVQQTILVGLLTRKQVADALGLCTHSVMRFTRRGLLPAVTLGPRVIRYRAEDIERFIQSGVTGKGGSL